MISDEESINAPQVMEKEQRVRHLQPHGISNIKEAGQFNFSRPKDTSMVARDTTQVPDDSMVESRIDSEASIAPLSNHLRPVSSQPRIAEGDDYEMGGVKRDVVEKNFPVFSFGFVFGCLFLLIIGLGFSAIQSFRLSSASL